MEEVPITPALWARLKVLDRRCSIEVRRDWPRDHLHRNRQVRPWYVSIHEASHHFRDGFIAERLVISEALEDAVGGAEACGWHRGREEGVVEAVTAAPPATVVPINRELWARLMAFCHHCRVSMYRSFAYDTRTWGHARTWRVTVQSQYVKTWELSKSERPTLTEALAAAVEDCERRKWHEPWDCNRAA